MRWETISFSSVLHAVSYSDRHAVNVVVWWNVGMLEELLFVYVQLITKLRFCKVWHSAVWCMDTLSVGEHFVSIFMAAESIACCGVRASARSAGKSCVLSWDSNTRTAPYNISEDNILGPYPCEIFKSHAGFIYEIRNKVRELIAIKVLHTSLLNTIVVAFKVLPFGSYAPIPAPSPPFRTILELVLWNDLQTCLYITPDVINVIKMSSFQYLLYLRELGARSSE